MFDLGLGELTIIAVASLIVLGPERLPKAAKTAGKLLGQLQRYITSTKAQLQKEIANTELSSLKTTLKETKNALTDSLHEVRDSLDVPAWEKLPPLRTPDDFRDTLDDWPPTHTPRTSISQQARQKRRQLKKSRPVKRSLRAQHPVQVVSYRGEHHE